MHGGRSDVTVEKDNCRSDVAVDMTELYWSYTEWMLELHRMKVLFRYLAFEFVLMLLYMT